MSSKNFNKELIRRYRDNKATEEELAVFFHLLNEGKLENDLAEVMDESFEEEKSALIVPMYKRTWFMAAAACIILLAGIGSYFLFFNNEPQHPIAATDQPKDVNPPRSSKAMITLVDGKKVYLDSVVSGELALQSNVKLIKQANGEISYQTTSGEKINELQYNTLSNPRGSKAVSVSLNDGTKVWLNSESSLKYPIAFVGNQRKVEITGEAYFEVAKDATKPFKVDIGGRGEVEVLGTHFNINSYSDEASINTTLLEGSVKVTALIAHNSQLIKPGEQAQLSQSGEISVDKKIDVEQIMAWKNGKFDFGEAMDVRSVMRQISRWYDVDVEYEGEIRGTIGGSTSRNLNASQVLKSLEETGTVKFRIEGKKVIVMSNKK